MNKELSESWSEFMQALSDKDGEGPLAQLKCPLLELLETQANIDRAKKAMFKPEIGQVLKLYLSRVPLEELSDKINSREKIFKRAFGVDKFNHLKLLVRLKIIEENKKPKRGLLAV